jgi:alkanesulfonate monooxygenase SsuD/methylene tetrahydromethanopterin reductase-like flavin-dependent oxidoreductase (luciferase family)
MKVYIFDLLPYDRHFEDAKKDRYLPYPLPLQHFDREVAARSYAEHIEAWKEMERAGFDGVALTEHHNTPHGLMNSPNMMAAVAAQHTTRLELLLVGNLIPLHNPLRIAEELSMVDCLSRGRIISGFARGVPREYKVYRVPMPESRARFEEAYEIIIKAWTEESFSYEGKFWSFQDIAIWPRPYQKPHPPVWIPFTGSKETIEWAGARNLKAVIPDFKRGLTEDMIGYYAKALAKHGHRITPDHLCFFTDTYVADSKADALREYGPYFLYFQQVLWHHGSLEPGGKIPAGGRSPDSPSFDYVRPENKQAAAMDREKIRNTTMADVQKRVESGELAFGSAKEVTESLIEMAEHAGANSLLLNLNLGARPNKLFIEQIRRFGREVLPKLRAHRVTRVPDLAAAV